MMQSFGKALAEKAADLLVADYTGRSDNESLKRNWQRLCARAFDIENQVKLGELSSKKKRKREVEDWLQEVEQLKPEINALETERSCWRLPLKEDHVAKLQLQVKELIEQSQHFGGLFLNAYDNTGDPCFPTKFFGENFKQNLEKIWPCLVADDISSIGIYGMGGVGKTTLAKHIKYFLLQNTNYRVCWVTVSQEFSINNLQDKIANVLGVHLSDKDEEEVRANILHEAFAKIEKLIVLILDNLWEEFRLEDVGISLGANKCRLILTTRSLELCHRMHCQRIFDTKILDTNEAWNLFKYTLGLETVLDVKVEEIARSVAKRCAGLPLGIITVAGSMRGVSDIREWRTALEQLKACSIGHDKMERYVFPILEWSFNRLNKYERLCFLYCALYPEDEEIKREELINLFIWAELIPKGNSRSAEFDHGHTVLNKFLRVCLLEKNKNYMGEERVKMHDLIRDMALRITSGNSILKIGKDVPRFLVKSRGNGFSRVTFEQKEWTEDLHAVSMYSNGIATEIPPGMSPNCAKLSTLLCPFLSVERIPTSFFLHMSGLKILNLSGSNIRVLPSLVSDMVSLTALVLRGCLQLLFVPPLGKLKQLRELDLSLAGIKDLPQGFESLVNLERLYMDGCKNLKHKIVIPKGTFSRQHRLDQLVLPSYVQVNDPKVLKQLDVFIGSLPFKDFCKALKISRWPTSYKVELNEFSVEDEHYYYNKKNDSIGYKKELLFHQCNFWRGWSHVPLLPKDIECLKVHKCVGLAGGICFSDVFTNLITLKHLSYIKIWGLEEVQFLCKWSLPSPPLEELVMSSSCPLQNLRELILEELPNLVGLFCLESEASFLPPGTFSSLTCFKISECHKMKKLFTLRMLQSLVNLVRLDVYNCEGLEEIAADDDRVEQEGGEGGIQIQSALSDATTIVVLPKLRRLYLSKLPELKNICQATLICDSVEDIWIRACPKLKRTP